jgi:hypothetical protein
MLRDADVLILGIHVPVEAAATDKAGFAELLEALVRAARPSAMRSGVC